MKINFDTETEKFLDSLPQCNFILGETGLRYSAEQKLENKVLSHDDNLNEGKKEEKYL